MRALFCAITTILLLPAVCSAGDIAGRVLGLRGEPIAGTTVEVLSEANTPLDTKFTDAKGNYHVTFPNTNAAVALRFSKENRVDVPIEGIAGTISGGRIDVVQPAAARSPEKKPPCNCYPCRPRWRFRR